MQIPRCYVDQALEIGIRITLPETTTHHLSRVLRLQNGNMIKLFNDSDYEYVGQLLKITKHYAEAKILNCYTVECRSSLQITLGIAIGHGKKMDYILQKAVELGVSHIVPVISKFSHLNANKRIAHWHRVILNATEQCGRVDLARLSDPLDYSAFLGQDPNKDNQFLLHPYAKNRFQDIKLSQKALTLMIGPEGGFSDDEYLQAEERGYMCVSLGKRILRMDTAALMAVGLCQYQWGDLC